MSRESRQRLKESAQLQMVRRQRERRFRWIGALFSVLILGSIVAAWKYSSSTRSNGFDRPLETHEFKQPGNFAELCAVWTNDLEKCDIAMMNLLCTEGLRGAENLNVKAALERLDGIANRVKFETDRHYYKFRQQPAEFKDSEGYYRMMMMATVLQQDLGVRYNPARIRLPTEPVESSEEFFANSQDVFIHGLVRENGTGTCSSMPVFFVAIGRRLGYPLKLVRAKGHLFARWEEGQQSFNIEGTSIGFVSHPDDYYRTWPHPFTTEEQQSEGYLKPLTATQELATFLSIRGACCRAATNWLQTVGAYAQAFYKEPQSVGNQKLFAWAERRAFEERVLPKRMALQYAIRSLVIPPGPMQPYFLAQQASLTARNSDGENESRIEQEIELLRAELNLPQSQISG
jgi:hypothetical protein